MQRRPVRYVAGRCSSFVETRNRSDGGQGRGVPVDAFTNAEVIRGRLLKLGYRRFAVPREAILSLSGYHSVIASRPGSSTSFARAPDDD